MITYMYILNNLSFYQNIYNRTQNFITIVFYCIVSNSYKCLEFTLLHFIEIFLNFVSLVVFL